MEMEKISKLARGTVRLGVEGAMPEQILNYCAERGVEFWDVSPKSDFCIYLSINAKDAPEIMAKNGFNGIEIKILSSKGGKNIGRALKRRYALIAALCLAVMILSASSLFIWRFDIEGNSRVSDAQVIRALSDCGVSYGSFWPSISTEKLRSSILLENKDIAWLSLNVRGSCAEVIVHERISKPEIISEKGSCDIVAAKSGLITDISVLEGQKNHAKGDTVTKGEVLISGTMESLTADDRSVRAQGSVKARTWYEINAKMPLEERRKSGIKREKTRYSLIIGKNRIKISADSRNQSASCDKITKIRMLGLDGAFILPVGIMKEHITEYETQVASKDESALIASLKAALHDELLKRIDGGEIVSEKYTVSKDDKTLTVTVRSECTEEIGITNDGKNDQGRENGARH